MAAALIMVIMSGSVVSQAHEVPLVHSLGTDTEKKYPEALEKGKIIGRDGNATAFGLPDGIRTYIFYDGLIWNIYFPTGGKKAAFYCNPSEPIWNKSN